ncbi:MAG TPA: hypothetical protein VMK53_11215 [Gemmatimonadales bacterium]|nr:hypothetical protein [Gemmatimonadales bacterium]
MADRIWVATRKGLFRLERKGAVRPKWAVTGKPAFLGDNVSMVLPPDGEGRMLAALDHGHFGVKLHRSIDGGKRWKEVAAPVMPDPRPGEEEWREPMGNRLIPQTVQRVWALEWGGEGDREAVWCGTIPGGLFRSTDLGRSWEFNQAFWDEPGRKEWFGGGADWPGIHSIVVDPANGQRVLAGVSCGGVWITGDGGRTWAQKAHGMRAAFMPPERQYDPGIQDPHLVVACTANQKMLWAQHHNGIFRSVDGSETWQEIEHAGPSTFGFAVAVHPHDGETAWFVPAIKDEKRIPVDGKFVVTRTRNGGRSFDILTEGLPKKQAYDLVYRHALAIDETGDRLAMGSTSGGVWVTENGGDAWQMVAVRLPPVYAVRWG